MSREISESIYLFSYSNEPNYRQRCNFKLKDKNHATVYLYWFFKGTDNVLIVRSYSFDWSNCITFESIRILSLKISLLKVVFKVVTKSCQTLFKVVKSNFKSKLLSFSPIHCTHLWQCTHIETAFVLISLYYVINGNGRNYFETALLNWNTFIHGSLYFISSEIMLQLVLSF